MLLHVASAEGRPQQLLVRALRIPASRVVALVDDLEHRRLLQRHGDPSDRRVRRLHLTPQGKRIVRELSELSAAHEAALASRVAFVDDYLSQPQIVDYLLASDVYVTPYLDPLQITSGTLGAPAGIRALRSGHRFQQTGVHRSGTAQRRSRAAADAWLVRDGWHVLPFDMSCTVLGLAAVRRATGNVRYGQAAQQARAWFARRNAAGKPVYDRSRGIVYDGVDEGRVNRNSGAESNIEGGLALVGSAPASVGPVREHELLVVAVCRPIGFSSDRRAGQRWSVALRKHHRPIRFDVAWANHEIRMDIQVSVAAHLDCTFGDTDRIEGAEIGYASTGVRPMSLHHAEAWGFHSMR
jgi:MarR family protein